MAPGRVRWTVPVRDDDDSETEEETRYERDKDIVHPPLRGRVMTQMKPGPAKRKRESELKEMVKEMLKTIQQERVEEGAKPGGLAVPSTAPPAPLAPYPAPTGVRRACHVTDIDTSFGGGVEETVQVHVLVLWLWPEGARQVAVPRQV